MRKLSLDVAAYAYQVAISADQLLNAVLGGFADETLSSRIYRNSTLADKPRRRWRAAKCAVNALFFWQADHCRGAYNSERVRRHMHGHFKE
ncbi:hypothetical protein [Neisseria weaveri]|uniref:hypothetical protein n=1 Tax=Neisseria weaveri TaxID=28091 RepID=UPI000D31EEDB|nr:hypothetical protein [Neisseria weaveri]